MLRRIIASQFRRPFGLFGIFTSNMMVKANQKNYDKLIADLALQPGDKILEIGYGPGAGIRIIADRCPGCTIHGIDFSKLMFKRASNLNKNNIDAGRVHLYYGDFLKTSALDNNYDKIICVNVIYFWVDLKLAFDKVILSLKEKGEFHIYMADKNTLIKKKAPDSVFNKYSIEQVVETLKSSGFNTAEYYSEKGLHIKAAK